MHKGKGKNTTSPYYGKCLEHVTKYQQYLNEERGKEEEGGVTESPKATKVTKPKAAKQTKPSTPKAPKHTSSQPPTSTPVPTKPSKKDQGKKRKLVKETSEAPSPAKRTKADVQGKGKEKVVDEQAAHDVPTFQTLKMKSLGDQFIFQKRTAMPTEPSGHAESSSLDEELALTDNESKFDKGVPEINVGDHDEGQARSNPEGTDASTQQNPEQMDEEFTLTACPNVQENLKLPSKDQFFVEKPHEEESEKTNTESDVQSMVMVPIHQDTSLVPLMTILVIDLIVSQPVSITVQALIPTSTAITFTVTKTTTLPPPPQPQQNTTDQTLLQRINKLEQHMENLLQYNLALEERLDKHGSRLYNLENLNIPHHVSKAVGEIVTDAVDWAMHAPLQARFSDLPAVDMKEILQQRIFKDKSYEDHEDHKNLFDALEKSLERDYSNQLLSDLEAARQKK
nr:hypothetical protein [Tanacetum cinerariifolium]